MSADLELLDIWRDLQKAGCMTAKPTSPLIQSCEGELVELMRELDGMTRRRRMDWAKERAILTMKAESKEKECALQQEAIDQKNKEVRV